VAVTSTSLRTEHPEWEDAPDAVVDAAIARAQSLISATVLGDRFDDAVALKACQLLALHPQGRDMRLEKDESRTIYDGPLEALLRAAGSAYRMVPL